MHVGMRRHQKRTVSKPADRKFAKKIKTAAKKTGKALGALLTSGLIITSFSAKAPAQNSQPSAPKKIPDKQVDLQIAARGDELPANTYVVPSTDGGEGAKKLGTSPEVKQKWCEEVQLKDGKIIFKGMTFGPGEGSTKIMNQTVMDALKEIGIDYTKVTNENMTFFEQRVDKNKCRAYLIVEVPVIRENYPSGEFETSMIIVELDKKNDSVMVRPQAFRAKVMPGSIYISKNGCFLAATTSCIEVVEPGFRGKKTDVTLSKLIGGEAPPMENPKISEENGWYVIIDPIMKNSQGEQMKVVFKVFPDRDSFQSGILFINEKIPEDW